MQIIPLEIYEQVDLCKWLDAKRLLYFAVPNGGSRHKLEAINLKKQGVKPGVSDMVVLLKDKILFIELKRQKKLLKSGKYSIAHARATKEQLEFLQDINSFSYAEGGVFYGWAEAKEYIEQHLHDTK